MSASSRTKQSAPSKRDRKRAEILVVATREINRHGLQGLLLSDVAALVSMTTANLTYYFRRKEDLEAFCFDHTFAAYRQMIEGAASRETAQTRIAALFEAFFDHAKEVAEGQQPSLVGLGNMPALSEAYAGRAAKHYRDLLNSTASLFDAPDGRHLTRPTRMVRAQLILSQLFWSARWIEQCDTSDYPRIARRLGDLVTNGLALRGATACSADINLPEMGDAGSDGRAGFYRAATGLINLLGYRGASIDRIGAAVNVTKGSVYHHYQSKEDLVMACSDRSFTAMWAIMRTVKAKYTNPWQCLSATVDALMKFQVGPDGPFLRSSARNVLPLKLQETMVMQWTRVIQHFSALIADGIAEGLLRPVDPFLSAQAIVAGINTAEDIKRYWRDGRSFDVNSLCAVPTLFGVLAED